MPDFTKLSNLINDTFTVQGVKGYCYKLWSPEQNKMLVSDTPQKGYRKLWQVTTDKGQLDLGAGQMGNLLEGAMHGGVADINNMTYEVKSNGKTGMEVRYFLNPVKKQAPPEANEPPPEWEGF